MEQRALGTQGLAVSAIGLGCMGMSDFYGADRSADLESTATIQRALDLGVTLLDTGDFYGMGHNEMLIGRAIQGRRDQAILSVKFGALRDPSGVFIGFDGRPAYVKTSLAYSLRRLGVDHIDLYYPARVDPNVPIEETIGAVGDLIKQGKVRYAGLSEASAATVRRAHAAHPISALQIEYSLWSRDPEDEVLPTLRELGVGLVAYGALSRGLFGGAIGSTPGDGRAHFPRFQGDNLTANLALFEKLKQLGAQRRDSIAARDGVGARARPGHCAHHWHAPAQSFGRKYGLRSCSTLCSRACGDRTGDSARRRGRREISCAQHVDRESVNRLDHRSLDSIN